MLFTKKQEQETNKVINQVVEISISQIVPNPNQPRTYFDDYSLTQLAVSIQQNGILQPLIVRRTEGGYQLIAGERRLRAARLVNFDTVPCIISESEDKDSAVLALLENIQREDLNFLEEALAIKKLIGYYGLTQEEAAFKLGMAQSTVANKLRLLKLSDVEKAAVLKYGLNERQARAILKLPEGEREAAILEVYKGQLNSTQTEKLVEAVLQQIEDKKQPKPTIINKTNPMNVLNLYLNSFKDTVNKMKSVGISCDFSKTKTEDFLEYSIRIPLK